MTKGSSASREQRLQIGVGVADERFVAVYFDAPGDQFAEGFVFASMVDRENLRDAGVFGEAEFQEVGVLEAGGAAEDVAGDVFGVNGDLRLEAALDHQLSCHADVVFDCLTIPNRLAKIPSLTLHSLWPLPGCTRMASCLTTFVAG